MEDEKINTICDKLTDEELMYLTMFLSAKIIKELANRVKKQNGKHK